MQEYAREVFSAYIPSNQGIKKAIKRGAIRVNGEPTTTGLWVQAKQSIELLDLQKTPPKVFQLRLEVVYEDDYLAVIVKPAGIVVSGNQYKTIQNALIYNLKPSEEKDALSWPRPLHRLDNPTSGLLLIAKTARAQTNLGQQFENKAIQKRYRAIVIGAISENGIFDNPVEGKAAKTTFQRVLEIPSLQNEWLSLLDLSPHTGRTHQLRIHLSQAGFPIVGDTIYGTEGHIFKEKGLFLSAVELSFWHPISQKQMRIKMEMPAKFESFLKRELRRWEKYNSGE